MADALKFKLTGVKEVSRRLLSAGKKAVSAVGQAQYEVLNRVMDKAQEQAPRDTGELRRTGFVTLPSPVRKQVTIGFGASYAREVHDNDKVPHASPTKSQYLADPVNEAKGGMERELANSARKHFKRGSTARRGKYATRSRRERGVSRSATKRKSRKKTRSKRRR